MSKISYNHHIIEPKWQKRWEKDHAHVTGDPVTKPKKYILSMFPYPSGYGLHIGHSTIYTATDIFARYHRLKGSAVMHPMGWDAFGLPAENYAIKQGVPPQETTAKNIANYKQQVTKLGLSYDWNREINSSTPDYYRWTQWMFLQLYKAGLAYQKEAAVNWCEKDQTVLANEQVVNGMCDRCGNQVVQKQMKQWFFKITDYADQLLTDLDGLDWPEFIKTSQRNWIGRSEGLTFNAPVKNSDIILETFSAHFEACYADTFVVIAPEHALLPELVAGTETEKEVLAFADNIIRERSATRTEHEPTGIFTGRYIINPLDGQELPIWVASFALAHYGTGIVKCSAHDERDFAFAKKYDIPLKVCLLPSDSTEAKKVEGFEYCYSDMKKGILTEPAEVAGQTGADAHEAVIAHCEAKGFAKRSITYKLRDWLISRQRYWGAPIPIIHCPKCGVVPVPEDQLPVELPTDVDFRPHGHSPLADSATFLKTICPSCGGVAQRETDTMDTFVCSSWYFLRYASPTNDQAAFDLAEVNQWLPVDMYVGGAEHAVLHLLYARFFTKFLRDQKLIDFSEPFLALKNVGMILGPDHQKMSKSIGNIINPDEMIIQYGADALRLHMMFLGPFSDEKPWSTETIKGVVRFLDGVWHIITSSEGTLLANEQKIFAPVIKKVDEDTANFRFNTAISSMMELVGTINKQKISDQAKRDLLIMLFPYAPHITSELWEQLEPGNLYEQAWPLIDEADLVVETVTVAVQINGKLRGTIAVKPGLGDDAVTEMARQESNVARHLVDKTIKRTIVVTDKIVNFILNN